MPLKALEKAAAQLRLAQTVQLSPTIVIGLGGSGTYTARRLKRLMELRYGLPPLIQFLYLDCDQNAFASKPELAEVMEEEVSLSIQNPEQILEDARRGVGTYEPMRDWLPDGLRVSILRNAIGAGGIRPVGRFAFFSQLPSFQQKFQGALRNAQAIEQQLETLLGERAGSIKIDPNQLRLYVVGSLCGGTGSSLFLDVAILVRHFIRQQAPNATPSVIGIFYLPSVFQNVPTLRTDLAFFNIILANAYAALMELEYFCDAETLRKNPLTFRYPHIGEITVSDAVYDEDFVVESFTPDGNRLLRAEEVFEMVARSLLADIGSPVGAQIRTADANIRTVLTMEPCPVTKKRRVIHGLGATSVALPVTELLERGALRIVKEFLADRLLGNPLPAAELDAEINSFLQTNRLDERGERNDLLEALLTAGEEKFTYSRRRTREELEKEAGGSEVQQAQYVANWVENELNRIRTEVVPEADRIVRDRKLQVLQSAVGAISGKLQSLAKEKGLRAARSFLEQLIVVFESVQKELTNEQNEHETNVRPSLENQIANQVAFLRSLQGLWGSIKALGRVDEQAMETALNALEELGKKEVLAVARQHALELLGSETPIDGQPSLLKRLKDWLQQIDLAIAKAERVKKECDSKLSTRFQVTPTGSTYTLEQWVISPSEFDHWLERLGIKIDDASVNAMWQALGENWEQQLKTLNESSETNLLERLASSLADSLQRKLQGLNIMDVIEEKRRTDEKQRLDVIMGTMIRVCQPFWSAPKNPPGGTVYQFFSAFTVPIESQDDPRFREIQSLAEDLTRQYGYQPQFVHNGYPFAIDMVVRVYGARGFYLTSTEEMRNKYEQKRQDPQTAAMLHLDKRFLDLLPKLHPEAS